MIKYSTIKINYTLAEKEKKEFKEQCPEYEFTPTIINKADRIITMGDIHGDLDVAKRMFKAAKLIDSKDNWIANPKDTIVIQIGDQIDDCRPSISKCNDNRAEDIKVIEFFNQMHEKASKQGGGVHSLIGNHEIMNVQGDFTYVSKANLKQFKYENSKGELGRKEAFQPGGDLAKMLACTRKAVIIVNNIMFIHAGIIPQLVKQLKQINGQTEKLLYLNRVVREWLLNNKSNFSQDSILSDAKLSPFWSRVYGEIPKNISIDNPKCSDEFAPMLKLFQINDVVIGHTPQIENNHGQINGTCFDENGQNRLYRVDGGFSKAFQLDNGHVQVLEILNGSTFNILSD